jgi:hypothetical protein
MILKNNFWRVVFRLHTPTMHRHLAVRDMLEMFERRGAVTRRKNNGFHFLYIPIDADVTPFLKTLKESKCVLRVMDTVGKVKYVPEQANDLSE